VQTGKVLQALRTLGIDVALAQPPGIDASSHAPTTGEGADGPAT
jgi:hypothetical protein